jgi:hypothetical protein
MFILLLLYYWLQVSASKGHLQGKIYKKLGNAGANSTKSKFYGIPFTFISSLYKYYQDRKSVV